MLKLYAPKGRHKNYPVVSDNGIVLYGRLIRKGIYFFC